VRAALHSSHPRWLRLAAPSTSHDVEHVRIGGLRPRFVPHFSNHFLVVCSCDVTSAKPTTESACASVSGQAQIRPCTTRPIITLSRRHACQTSMRREPHPVRPFHCGRTTNIDARNGHAYHGRKKTTTNETQPAALGSRSGEGQRAQWQQRRRVASHVRSCPGAPGRTRVLRTGIEAEIANDSKKCRT